MQQGGFMRIALLTVALAFASFTSASAAAERPATKAEIEKTAVGKTLGVKKYMANGRYTYQGGNPGTYTISEGKICISFDNGRSRCDRIVTDGKAYTLVNGEGERYPFK
jgi:outer membrane lipoprotein-sorting protein